jgi:dephospho-CoA kinase
MKVIGIVGMPGSGKGEFSSVAEELNIPVVVMGDAIRQEVRRQGLPPTDESMGKVAKTLRDEFGMAAIAHVCIPLIEEQADKDNKIILVDGIRGDAEVREFMNHFPGFALIFIDAPQDIRFKRLSERGRSDDLICIEELINRDERECSFGLSKAIEMATDIIPNKDSRDAFRQEVYSYLNKLSEAI